MPESDVMISNKATCINDRLENTSHAFYSVSGEFINTVYRLNQITAKLNLLQN